MVTRTMRLLSLLVFVCVLTADAQRGRRIIETANAAGFGEFKYSYSGHAYTPPKEPTKEPVKEYGHVYEPPKEPDYGYGKGKGKGKTTTKGHDEYYPDGDDEYYPGYGYGKGKGKGTKGTKKTKGHDEYYSDGDDEYYSDGDDEYYPGYGYGKGKGKGKGKGYDEYYPEHYPTKRLKLTVTNTAYQQPFSAFFVMVHNEYAEPLFVFGEKASDKLALLAQTGDSSELVDFYEGEKGVFSVATFDDGEPYFLGEEAEIIVEVTDEYPLVTIAAMMLNTNDGFVAINGQLLYPGDEITVAGHDAGSEENNERCSDIPGPACDDFDTSNDSSGDDEGYSDVSSDTLGVSEGFVAVHRGIHGIGDLTEKRYDWRNPVAVVIVTHTEPEHVPSGYDGY